MNTKETFSCALQDIWMDMAPFMLIGLIIAFICTYFMTERRMQRHLGGNSLLSIVKASLIGVPIPFCSCGVLPVALALRKNGASVASSTAFLASTSQSGADVFPLTCHLFSLPFACLRFIGAIISGLVCGYSIRRASVAQKEDVTNENAPVDTCSNTCCCHHHTPQAPHEITEPHHHEYVPRKQRLKEAAIYAFIHLPREIAGLLLLGFVIAVLIRIYLPLSWLGHIPPMLGYLAAIVIGIPMYACSVAIIPIAFTLIEAGLSLGSAFILLVTAPTMSIASLMILNSQFGRKVVIRYILSICLIAILSAVFLDLTPRVWWLVSEVGPDHHHHHHYNPFLLTGAIVFTLILIVSQVSRFLKKA